MVDELLLTDGQRLHRRILECPEDDAPRLIYSDWLEEQGEEAGGIAGIGGVGR
jgi:uncharacterized protein (TIGR02996 family)